MKSKFFFIIFLIVNFTILHGATFTGNELSEDNSALSKSTNKKIFGSTKKVWMWKRKGVAGNRFRIGFVDLEKVFNSLAEKKLQESKLQDKKDKFQNEIKAKENEIARLEKDYDANASLWTAETRMKRRLVIEKKWQKLQILFDKYRIELLSEEQGLKAPIFERIKEAVVELGEKEKFDMILNSNESVIWGKKIYDITDKVIMKIRISKKKEDATIK